MTPAPLTTEQLDEIEEAANKEVNDGIGLYQLDISTMILSMVAEIRALRESEATLRHEFKMLQHRVPEMQKQIEEAFGVICIHQSLRPDYLKKWYPERYK